MTRIFTIKGWSHDPKRRKHRWRCQECMRVIEDGSDVTVERRGKASHGYHTECFDAATKGALPSSAGAALARADFQHDFDDHDCGEDVCVCRD